MARTKKVMKPFDAPGNPLQVAVEIMRGEREPAPPKAWVDPRPDVTTLPGRDHRSLLLFLQTVEANEGGDVRHAATRGCMGGHSRMRDKNGAGPCAWNPANGTRYDDGRVDGERDDWDCMGDLESWGFIRVAGSGTFPLVTLTDKGHGLCAVLIRERGQLARKNLNWPN
jgi:hypothetical protein